MKFPSPLLSFIVSVIGFLLGLILTNSTKVGICVYEGLRRDPACGNFYERLGDPLFYGFGALSIIFLILIFAKRAFSAWKKFAIWSLPILALLFVFYPEPGAGDFVSPDSEALFKWVSGAYVLVSLGIIGVASLGKRK